MSRTLLACAALFGSSLVIWACATSAVPIDNVDVPETGAPDTSQASNDAGCPQYDLNNDPKHCGSCTKACTDLQVCAAGVCKAACDLPTVKCVGDGGAGGCVDLTKDPQNCGGCNNKCAVVDAGAVPTDNGNDSGIPAGDAGVDSGIAPQAGTPACVSSKCGVTCPPGLTGCADSICYDTMNNHDHCGGCSTACATDTEWCTAGHCCGTGQQYCNNACIDVLGDSNNCGGCGIVCPNNAKTCSNGACVACDSKTEATYNGKCYYLDGSGGNCDVGYSRAPNTTIAAILLSNGFVGKNYKHQNSSNCCVWTSDAVENYGMGDHCNANGPFTANDPKLGAAGCTNQMNHNPGQLTFCGSN
jgi:hypothetical protein